MKSSFPIKISLDQYIFIHRTLRDSLFNDISKEDILRLIKKNLKIISIKQRDNSYLIELANPIKPLDSKYIYIVFSTTRKLFTTQLKNNNKYILNCWINKKEQMTVKNEIDLERNQIIAIINNLSS